MSALDPAPEVDPDLEAGAHAADLLATNASNALTRRVPGETDEHLRYEPNIDAFVTASIKIRYRVLYMPRKRLG